MLNTYRYFKGCLETDEEVVALGLHENEDFIADVIDEYHHNLKFVSFDYSEPAAKDDAIETVLNRWKDKERE